MKTFKQFLIESLSPIVYHFTTIDKAINILEDNAFLLSFASDELDKYHNTKLYFLSTARSKSSIYGYRTDLPMICFVLDGNRLNQKYGAKSVNYSNIDRTINSEMEDRIITSHPKIMNANQFIIRIDVYNHNNDSFNEQDILRLVGDAKKLNIPSYFYSSAQSFLIAKHGIVGSEYIKSFIPSTSSNDKGWDHLYANQ